MYLASLNVNGKVEANLSRVGATASPPLLEVPSIRASVSKLQQAVSSCTGLTVDDAIPLATSISDLGSVSGQVGSLLSVVCL